MIETVDALIVGGGPAGSSTALCLARAGWSVLVVEKKTFPRRKVCGEYLSASNSPLWDELGLTDLFDSCAGPSVKRVALFAGESITTAPLPSLGGRWGKALSREKLDTFLLNEATASGARVLQPASAKSLRRSERGFRCTIEHSDHGPLEIETRVLVAAHGSWEKGTLPSQNHDEPARASDLLGFKAHFRSSSLPSDLMPLFVFPGGYGGMVSCEDDRVSLSCCIRRDRLGALRDGNTEAGEVVLAWIRDNCRGVRDALDSARREGSWLGAGPIRPGIRLRPTDDIFRVGNAAGEAHPVVAEGISMALQAGWILGQELRAMPGRGSDPRSLRRAMTRYCHRWREAFAPRIRTSSVIAQWAMRPLAVALVKPVLLAFPSLLSWGAKLSGKVRCPVATRTTS